MVIFDLDGTLADCNHRRRFVNPEFDEDAVKEYHEVDRHGIPLDETKFRWFNSKGEKWKPDWDSFYEACNHDLPIWPAVRVLESLFLNQITNKGIKIEIWSGRSESVREKTEHWLKYIIGECTYSNLKMRPIGDFTPDDILKESWLNQRCSDLVEATIEGVNPQKHDIEYVFDDRPKVVRMWRRRGVFVFNLHQSDDEF